MSASSSHQDGSIVTIQYNDKTVKVDPNRPVNIRWTSGKNGMNKSGDQRAKPKYLNPDIPIARFRRIEMSKFGGASREFKIPNSYVQCTDHEEEAGKGEVEYDLDREDMVWLQLANARRRKMGKTPIDEETLEQAMDMLEKESHFQFKQTEQSSGGLGYLPMLDNDAPCCICNDGEDSNANQIIFCDMCNIAVHQECYGVPYIPEGQWLCRRCQMSPSIPVTCALCPYTAGAFKQTADGRWAHVICAIWLNEVHFANTVFMEPVEGVDFSIKRRHKLTCLVCRKKVGACLQCSNRACVRSFHVTCGRNSGIRMVVQESKAKNNPEVITINRFAYCHKHSNLGSSDQSAASMKRDMEQKIREARKMLELSAKQTPRTVPMPVIPREKVNDIARRLGLDHISDICAYWSLKRNSRFGVPLIRRLQVYLGQQKPMTGRPSLDGVLDTSGGRKSGAESAMEVATISPKIPKPPADPIQRYAGMRRNFERVRLLCELIKKREKMKRETVLIGEKILNKTFKPPAILLQETLDKLIEKDHQQVFTQPVTEAEVPGYSAIIPRPMDFQRMRAQLERGRYKRVADLRADFLLMMQNCATFNRDNQYFYNYGQRIRRIGLKVIGVAEAEEARINEVSDLMDRTVTSFPSMDSNALAKFNKELKLHEQQGTKEEMSTTVEKSEKSKNEMVKEEPTESAFSAPELSNKRKRKSKPQQQTNVMECDKAEMDKNVADQTPKKKASHKKKSQLTDKNMANISITKKDENEDDGQMAKSAKKGKNSRKQQDAVNEESTTHDEDQGMKRKSGNSINKPKSHKKKSVVADANDGKKEEQPRMIKNQPLFDANLHNKSRKKETPRQKQQLITAYGSSSGRGVNKQSYANAYLTEASSAAEEDEDQLASMLEEEEEEDNELPTALNDQHHSRRSQQSQRRRGARMTQEKKAESMLMDSGDDFGPPSPNSFSHNDIVLVQTDDEEGCSQMPARVIDIRMRAIGLEGLGKHFVDQALAEMPRGPGGQSLQNYTLVVIFDRENTCKWIPNSRVRILYPFELNKKSAIGLGKNRMAAEALDKAREFWKNVVDI